MKKLFLTLTLALTLCSVSLADNQGEDQVKLTSVTDSSASPVAAGTRSITFIFSSGFTGTINGVAFAGSADSSLSIVAPAGDTLGTVPYTVGAGTLRIVITRRR